jgi:hypothetical protein
MLSVVLISVVMLNGMAPFAFAFEMIVRLSQEVFLGHLCNKMQISRSAVCSAAVAVFFFGLVVSSVEANQESANPLNRCQTHKTGSSVAGAVAKIS